MSAKDTHVGTTMFYGSLLLASFGFLMAFIAGEHPVWAYLAGSGLGGAVASAWRRQKVHYYSVKEMSEAVRCAEQSAFNEGVRFALEWEEHYVKGADPLTKDHLFGVYTLVMKPRRLKKRSSDSPEKCLRAIQAEGRLALWGLASPQPE